MRRKRKIMNAISEILCFIAICLMMLALTWAFWVCGDDGPDHTENVLMVLTLVFGASGLATSALAGRRRR